MDQMSTQERDGGGRVRGSRLGMAQGEGRQVVELLEHGCARRATHVREPMPTGQVHHQRHQSTQHLESISMLPCPSQHPDRAPDQLVQRLGEQFHHQRCTMDAVKGITPPRSVRGGGEEGVAFGEGRHGVQGTPHLHHPRCGMGIHAIGADGATCIGGGMTQGVCLCCVGERR